MIIIGCVCSIYVFSLDLVTKQSPGYCYAAHTDRRSFIINTPVGLGLGQIHSFQKLQ